MTLYHHPKEDTVPDLATADQSLTAAQLTERIRAASTLDELTALRGVLVDHDGPIVAGEFFEAAKLYGERRRQMEGAQGRREVADATAEAGLEAELANLHRPPGHKKPQGHKEKPGPRRARRAGYGKTVKP